MYPTTLPRGNLLGIRDPNQPFSATFLCLQVNNIFRVTSREFPEFLRRDINSRTKTSFGMTNLGGFSGRELPLRAKSGRVEIRDSKIYHPPTGSESLPSKNLRHFVVVLVEERKLALETGSTGKHLNEDGAGDLSCVSIGDRSTTTKNLR